MTTLLEVLTFNRHTFFKIREKLFIYVEILIES